MWSALDSGFALRKASEMWKDRKYTSRAFRPLHKTCRGDSLDGYFPEAQLEAGSGSGLPNENDAFSNITRDTLKEPH